MQRSLLTACMVLTAASAWPADDAAPVAGPTPAALEFFEKKVRPLLVNHCYNCHSADHKEAGGLRVDDYQHLLKGGSRGAAVVPGDPENSILMKAVRHTDDQLKMPPEFPLTEEQVGILRQWIQDGAAWPTIEVPANLIADPAEYAELRQRHWAWQPLQPIAPPIVQNSAWPRDDVDRFLLAKLEETALLPVADADPAVWLRRVTFDLTGLPPTPEDILSFLIDESPMAKEQVVDRLLQSPAFGECWGRHWLDVARYGESTGSARNLPYPYAWRYRDYVIDAFNKDKPYDQFIREQIAGDLLPAQTEEQRHEQLIATGFLAIGVKDVNQRFKVRYIMDNIDEQIDTFSQAILGLTVSCARCHDHKFDPISTKEYYALAGIFHSTDLCAGLRNKMGGGGLDYYDPQMLLLLGPPDQKVDPELEAKIAAAKTAADEAKAKFEQLRDSPEGAEPAPNGKPKRQVARQRWNKLQAEYVALSDLASQGKAAMGVRDGKTIGDTQVRVRGEAEQLGPVVPRGFLEIIHYENQPRIPTDHSGRLELAQWLTSPQNPLTARVVVNRIWQHLFGTGLVSSVDNFGVNGDRPSHPELLDHLAIRFQHDGWSSKRMIRALVLSRAYGLSSSATEEHLTKDPANRLVWRHSPRRLSAEELRDATLAAAGTLDRTQRDGSPAQELQVIELRNNGPESQKLLNEARNSMRRSVYLPLLRTLVPPALEVFDFADQGLVTGRRETTTVATQALYLLNDAVIRRNALLLAESLLTPSDQDDNARVKRTYLMLLGRLPSPTEVERAEFYLAETTVLAGELLQAEFAALAERERQAAMAAIQPADAVLAENTAGRQALAAAQQQAAQAVNPDDVEQTDAVDVEISVQARDPVTAAWSSFVQALMGTAEYRYLR